MISLGQKDGNHWLEEAGRSHEGTHRTKLMEIESTELFFVPKDARVLIHSATEHACWRGESNSSERTLPGQVPQGLLCACRAS